MRLLVLTVALAAGCSFNVRGVDSPAGGPPGSGAPPTISSPAADGGASDSPLPGPDLAMTMPPVDHPPGPSGPADMAPPAPKPKAIGDACSKSSDCGNNRVCLLQIGLTDVGKFPGGYCTQSCSTTACPAGAVCQSVAGTPLCLAQCPPTKCRSGYDCCGPQSNECLPSTLCD